MTVTNEQIQALEAAAEAATKGDWTADDNFGFTIQCYRTGTNRLLATVNGLNAENDMRFISLASPQNILRVLAERDADKALIAEQTKRIAELEARTVSVKLPESVIDAICLTAANEDIWENDTATITRLYDRLNDDLANPSVVKALAEFALAAHEQEPVMEVRSHFNGEYVCRKLTKGTLKPGVKLYYNPAPVPAVPDDIPAGLAGTIVSLCAYNVRDKELAQKIWNACRAAMLNGGKS